MNVLHVHSGNLYGGIETVVATLVREDAARVLAHRFALCFGGRLERELRAAGAPIEMLGEVRLRNPRSIFAARGALRRLVRATAPDVIVTHLPWTHATFGSSLRAGRTPVLQWVHGPIGGLVGTLARRALPDALICNSQYTRATLPSSHRSLPADTIMYPLAAAPAPDRATRARIRESLSTAASDVVVVQASRLEAWKGHREHLRALGRLADVPGWVLWIVGGAQRPSEAAYETELRQLARSLGIDARVRFVGQRSDVAQYLSAADLYCQPNIEPEPFGMTFVEALQSGLPVVASRTGALPEIVDAGVGVLVPPGDIGELSSTLHRLIEHGDVRGALADRAPGRARALCDPAAQVSRIADYMNAVARRSAA